MKKEKGSALLTVILIAAVTATIGAAISSFILMNYRFRLYDTHIRRAEYLAEEAIDTIHLYLLSEFGKSDGLFYKMKNTTENDMGDIKEKLLDFPLTSSSEYYDYDGTDWIEKENARQDYFLKLFKDLKNDSNANAIKKVVKNIIGENGNLGLDGNNNTIIYTGEQYMTQDGNIYVELGDTIFKDDASTLTQKVYIYYVIPKNAVIKGKPIARFSVDYVIACPTFYDVYNSKYKITNYIGITNWTIENNWNL